MFFVILFLFVIYLSIYFIGKKYNKFNKEDIFILLILYFVSYIILNKNEYMIIYCINVLIFSLLYLVIIVDRIQFWIPNFSVYGIFILNLLKLFLFYILNIKIYYNATLFIFIFSLFIIVFEIIFKKEYIGFGDLKLLATLSIGIELINFLYMVILSSLIGLIIFCFKKNKQEPIAFGPCIVISYVLLLFFN